MDIQRITIGSVISAVIVAAILFVPAGNPLTLIVLLAICSLAMREFYGLLQKGGMPASKRVGMSCGLLFVAATWIYARQGFGDRILWALLLLFVLINFFRLLVHPDARLAIRNALGTLFGFVYVAFFWSFFVRIFMVGPLDKPSLTGLYLLLAVKGADSGAYLIGSRFGKHKLFPRVSPKKSWEGLIGGIVCASVIGALWWIISDGRIGAISAPFLHALLLGFILPIVGTLGDLVESIFKRAVDVKDSGELAHGLGGMLDMIDSLLFTAPFMYMYVEFFF
jgi:phosphatidate cytidylyltransferase